MFRILESQAPAKQTASDTINTLSGRLQSASLLEDRRAAILGLRSFAKVYPDSVASGALRNLINSLSSDGEDVETTKIVLETLLMLFNPDESSLEASEDIALWLADEFTQHQENITILLDLLDRQEFFSRLYSLQLISAISSARLERTQECVYTAPLGVSRLVALLDDKREAIRSEGLLLLCALTPDSPDLQKLVAFENAFDRIFAIVDAEGSLSNGGIVVQDCLSLLASLLRLNVSNQSFFRETGGVTKVAALLQQALRDADIPASTEWSTSQRDKNLWGFLSVIRLFLNGGSVGTQVNQNSFWQNGVVFSVIDIAFDSHMAPAVRSEAFEACADLIRANSSLQESFAQREIRLLFESDGKDADATPKPNGERNKVGYVKINVIQGLLDTALAVSSQPSFEVRLAASECIKAYLQGHGPIRLHFLRRAKDGHSAEEPEPDNIFTILLQDADSSFTPDPYRHWIASIILFHLLFEDCDAKKIAMEIIEGDSEKGEEAITCIQALSGCLLSKAQRGSDGRITIGYLIVLAGWLFEDPDAVNDFLQEGTNVQSLIQLILQPSQQKSIEAGLGAFLLGIIYEFSSKDSPVPRSTLHDIIITRLGREQYNDKMAKLREHPFVRDFEVLPQVRSHETSTSLPDVYFDKKFIDFLKDNFSRVLRAIDRDPSIEVSVVANGVQKGISRELVDSLRIQLDDKTQNVQRLESELLTFERKLEQERADHRKAKESASIELGRIRTINETLQRNHEDESKQAQENHRRALNDIEQRIKKEKEAFQFQIDKSERDHEAQSSKMRAGYVAEIDELKSSVHSLEKLMEKSAKDHAQDLHIAHEEYESSRRSLELRLERAEQRAQDADLRAAKVESVAHRLHELIEEKENARAAAQAELDDLLMVLGDLEEKREKDKSRLRSLGEAVSDDDEGSDNEASDEGEPSS